MNKPTIGRVVHVLVDPMTNNGADVAPALITRVWSQNSEGGWCVNVRVMRDNAPHESEWRTSIYLWPDEETARAAKFGIHAFWPPRV